MDTQHTQEQQNQIVEWAVARRKVTSGREEAQLPVVKATPSGILIAVVDGMEHGQNAAAAAQSAASILESYTHQTLIDLFARCDKECRTAGGVSISAAIFNRGRVSWFGVGNVNGIIYHHDPESTPPYLMLEQFGGLVGDGHFKLREQTIPLKPGDLTILASDGMKPEFVKALPIEGKPRVVADQLLSSYTRDDADSLIIVTRYLG